VMVSPEVKTLKHEARDPPHFSPGSGQVGIGARLSVQRDRRKLRSDLGGSLGCDFAVDRPVLRLSKRLIRGPGDARRYDERRQAFAV
jgi:hypothetical protein